MNVYANIDQYGKLTKQHIRSDDSDYLLLDPTAIKIEAELPHFNYCYKEGVFVELPPPEFYWLTWTGDIWEDLRPITIIKNENWVMLKKKRDAAEFSTFMFNGVAYDCDAVSRARIQGEVQFAMLVAAEGSSYSINWTTADNTVETLTGADVIQLGLTLGVYTKAVHTYGAILRDRNEKATQEEVPTIDWDTEEFTALLNSDQTN